VKLRSCFNWSVTLFAFVFCFATSWAAGASARYDQVLQKPEDNVQLAEGHQSTLRLGAVPSRRSREIENRIEAPREYSGSTYILGSLEVKVIAKGAPDAMKHKPAGSGILWAGIDGQAFAKVNVRRSTSDECPSVIAWAKVDLVGGRSRGRSCSRSAVITTENPIRVTSYDRSSSRFEVWWEPMFGNVASVARILPGTKLEVTDRSPSSLRIDVGVISGVSPDGKAQFELLLSNVGEHRSRNITVTAADHAQMPIQDAQFSRVPATIAAGQEIKVEAKVPVGSSAEQIVVTARDAGSSTSTDLFVAAADPGPDGEDESSVATVLLLSGAALAAICFGIVMARRRNI